jgi:hypothetical protein
MISMSLEPQDWQQVLEDLSALESYKCRLRHENAQYQPTTGLPILNELGTFELSSQCPIDVRKNRLGCPHYGTNYRLFDVARLLNEVGAVTDDELDQFRAKIEAVAIEIVRLDREKAAITLTSADLPADTLSIKYSPIETKHDQCVDIMAGLRDQLIDKVKELMSNR